MPDDQIISTQKRKGWINEASVVEQIKELLPRWQASVDHAEELQKWVDSDAQDFSNKDKPLVPDTATREQRRLRDSSLSPWAHMIASSQAHHMIFDDIRLESGGSAPALRLIERNSLGSRQAPVHFDALVHGKSFNLITPGVGRRDGKKTAIIRGKSALRCNAFFRDDFDEFPDFFMEVERVTLRDGKEQLWIDFYDEGHHHVAVADTDFSNVRIDGESKRHGMTVCPVVRFAPHLTLTGRTIGEVEPYIGLIKRINQDTNDRLIVQRYGAFVIRTIAGMMAPATEEERKAQALALTVTDLLISPDKDTKFSALQGTQLDGYIRSREADIRDLGAASATPIFHMLGLSDNVGAEGLAAAESAHIRKRNVIRNAFAESWEASFRLGGEAMDEPSIADDFSSRLHWAQTDTYAFQSLAQGLSALATGLGIPGEMLWRYIPDWNQEDTRRALKLIQDAKQDAQLDAELEASRQVETQTAIAAAKGASSGNAAAA